MKKFKIPKVVGLFLSFLVLTVLIVGCEKDPVIPVISKHTIDAKVNGIGGTLSLPGKTDVLDGGGLTISFIPDKDYEVDVVKVDNTPITTPANLSYPFTNVKANHTLEVTFKKIIKKFIVNVSVSTGGSANPLGTKEVTEGDNLDITFNPNMGYKTSSVMVNGVSYPLTSNVYPLKNISADTKVKGVFKMSDTLRLLTQGTWQTIRWQARLLTAINWDMDKGLSELDDQRMTFDPITYKFKYTYDGALFGDGFYELKQDSLIIGGGLRNKILTLTEDSLVIESVSVHFDAPYVIDHTKDSMIRITYKRISN